MLNGLLQAIERRQTLFVLVFATTVATGLGWHGRQAARSRDAAEQERVARERVVRVATFTSDGGGRVFHFYGRRGIGGSGQETALVEIQQPHQGFIGAHQSPFVTLPTAEPAEAATAPVRLPSLVGAVAVWMFIGALLATASTLVFARR